MFFCLRPNCFGKKSINQVIKKKKKKLTVKFFGHLSLWILTIIMESWDCGSELEKKNMKTILSVLSFCFSENWPELSAHRWAFDSIKVTRKVQGMPQSQTTANPWHQEEEKKAKNIHTQNNKCTRSTKPSSLFPKWGDQNAKTNGEMRTQKEDFKTLSTPWYKPQSYTELRTIPGPPP